MSLLLAVVATFGIVRAANIKYTESSKTVSVVKTTQYIPAGTVIKAEDIVTVDVPVTMGEGVIQDSNQVINKAARMGILAGQLVYEGSVEEIRRDPNLIEVDVPTDISSSACVMAGEVVDIYIVNKSRGEGEELALELYRGARVLHAYSQDGNEINPAPKLQKMIDASQPAGTRIPVSVGLEVPREIAPALVQAASQNSVYLAKSSFSPDSQLLSDEGE